MDFTGRKLQKAWKFNRVLNIFAFELICEWSGPPLLFNFHLNVWPEFDLFGPGNAQKAGYSLSTWLHIYGPMVKGY